MVSMNVTVETMLIVLSIVGFVMLIMNLITQKLSFIGDYGFDKVQYKLMGNYLNKVFTTDFKNMENPDFLDLTNRAKQALYYGRGFHGYCMRMKVATEAFAMVILDEPTAALDPVAEYKVYQHFDSLVGGKTAVYISHRLSSCRFCDRIIVFNGGKIIEDGSHEELMDNPNGFYANMYNTQAKHYN